MTRAGTTEQRPAILARIILRAAEGAAHVAVADELGVSVPTVLLWRRRFRERGLVGSPTRPTPDDPGRMGTRSASGCSPRRSARPMTRRPDWSRARLARKVGVSASTVGRARFGMDVPMIPDAWEVSVGAPAILSGHLSGHLSGLIL